MIRLILPPVITLLLGFVLTLDPHKPDSGPAAYPEHLTGAFTGGFGEETCRNCHFDFDLNPDGGQLKVNGLDSTFEPGEIVQISLEVSREELGKAGFQLTARYADGRQAGTFLLENNDRVTFTNSVSDSVQYVQHSAKGVDPDGDGVNKWTIKWKIPDQNSSPLIFNIAANAGNGDQSEFGDFIYTEEITVDF